MIRYLRTRRRGFYRRIFFFCLLFLLIFMAYDVSSILLRQGTFNTSHSSIKCTSHSSRPVTLTMYYGSEKQAWIDEVVKDFNSRHMVACDGTITVKAYPIGSGQSMQQILDGTIQPDIWSPAGSVWLQLLNSKWRLRNTSDLVSDNAIDSPPLLLSPVVLAMWEPQARVLGWPNSVTWQAIYALSNNPQGWAAYNHAEWGTFKFGHTRPDYSNSGLDAVITENYAATHKASQLTTSDVASTNTKVADFVGTIESSVVHYGDSTGQLADDMFTKGPGYLSAAVVYESLVAEANDGKTYPFIGKKYPKVVAVYPAEGTFYSDHPFAIVQARWVTEAKRTSAQLFRSFLLDTKQQEKALSYGFRPADIKVPITAPLDPSHNIDPHQPTTTFQPPSASVVNEIISSWSKLRRRVSVMLLLDRSGSMNNVEGNESKIEAAKKGMQAFINRLSDSDEVGLTVISNDASVLTPVTQLGPKRENLLHRIAGITAAGSTRLYDTIAEQVKALQDVHTKNVKAVVVLTDGMDTSSQRTRDQLLAEITPLSENVGNGIKVFTIAYGNDADRDTLARIAHVTGGKECNGTPANIENVYLEVSSFFGVGDLGAATTIPCCDSSCSQ